MRKRQIVLACLAFVVLLALVYELAKTPSVAAAMPGSLARPQLDIGQIR